MIFLIIITVFLNASKYSDFVDSLYYEKLAQYSTSYKILDELSQQDKDPYLYYRKYDIALKGYRANQIGIDKLEENVKKMIEIEPSRTDNWILYAAVKLQKGQNDEAKKAYENVLKLDPKNVEAYYQLALLSSSDTLKSLSYFKKIIEIDPSLASDVYYNIAVLYSFKNDTRKVEEYIDKSIKENPKAIKPYYFLALWWQEKGDFSKTIEAYKKIVEIEPDNTDVLTKIAELYISTSNYSMAHNYFEKVIEYEPNNKKALWWLALLEENSKRYDKAIDYLSRIDGWQDDIDIVLKMSYYWVMSGSMDKTIGILENAHKKWPDNPTISYYLGLGMMDLGRYADAKRYFELVLSTQPDRYDLRYNLGVVCEKIGDVECFKRNFGYILIKNPNDASVLNYLGYSLVDRDIVDEEIFIGSVSVGTPFEMIKKAVDREPDNYAYLDSLGWAYFKKNEPQKALQYIEKSIESMKKISVEIDPLVIEHKADILCAVGRYDEAYISYTQSYISDSNNRRDIISHSALKILPYVSPIVLSENIFKLMPSVFEAEAEIKVYTEYKKFLLLRKKFKYTFSSIFQSDLAKNTATLKILGPLFTPILDIHKNIRDVRISFFSDNNDYRELIKNAFFAFMSYISMPSFFNSHTLLYQDGFVFRDIFEEGDYVLMKYEKNPILPDRIIYTNGAESFEVKVQVVYDNRSKKFIPSNILINHQKSTVDFVFNIDKE
ncbi:MAG: tetratricopeptide repeat protein [Elusimicrobiales bacterium]